MVLPIRDSVDLVRELYERDVPIYILSNWDTGEFEAIRALFPFLSWFRGILISGSVGILKPDPQIYGILEREYGLDPTEVAFIDDSLAKVEVARQLGFESVLFDSPAGVRKELVRLGLL